MNHLPYCDFHLHSTNSDGSLPVRELLKKAQACGIGTLAVTDHDYICTQEELNSLQAEFPQLNILSGCEFTANADLLGKSLEIHIVGLDFRITPEILEFARSNRLSDDYQRWYVDTMIRKLQACGILYRRSYADLKAAYPQQYIGRAILARDILQQGFLPGKTVSDVFDLYIGDRNGEKPAFVPKPRMFHSMQYCVGAIAAAGGIPVLAHPLSYDLPLSGVQALMQEFAQAGGLAVEVFYGHYSQKEQMILKELADRCQLAYSAGSDFHDPNGNFLNYHYRTADILPPLTLRQQRYREETRL